MISPKSNNKHVNTQFSNTPPQAKHGQGNYFLLVSTCDHHVLLIVEGGA